MFRIMLFHLLSFVLLSIQVLTQESIQTDLKKRSTSRPFDVPANWTTCEEFLRNTSLNVERVLNVDWKIFYFWSPEPEPSHIVRFRRPSDQLVDRFKMRLDKELKHPVNWSDAELFMESTADFSALLLKTNGSGLYKIIYSIAFDYPELPQTIVALKLVEPGYLGIANCKSRLAYGLAPSDKMPLKDKIQESANLLGFYSYVNRTYVDQQQFEQEVAPLFRDDDNSEETYDDDF